MTGPLIALPVHQLAHGRSVTSRQRVQLSLIPYRGEAWPWLVTELTEARVLARFRHLGATAVTRYALANLQALQFVVDGVIKPGMAPTLALDREGRCLSFWLLAMEIEVDAALTF
ncbi:MAG: hypothetical protein EA356_12550 [Geminicoccaceae bacterium]|nr:MAG: hypothetical protein EA356_12550 [Geminicoccaceae bacterium]